MVEQIFNGVLLRAFQFGLGLLDDLFDVTGMWPIYLGGIAIIMILRFVVLPMLMSSVQADGSEISQEQMVNAADKIQERKAKEDGRFNRRLAKWYRQRDPYGHQTAEKAGDNNG